MVEQPQVRDEPVRDESEQERGPGILTWVLLGAGVFGLGWVLRGRQGTRKVQRRGAHVEGGRNDAHGEHSDAHDERHHDKGCASESEGAGVATAVAAGAAAVAVASLVESSSSSDSSSSWDSSSSSSSSDFGGGSSSGGGSSGEW